MYPGWDPGTEKGHEVKTKYGRQLIIVRQYQLVNCNKYPMLMEDAVNRRNWVCDMWEFSVLCT